MKRNVLFWFAVFLSIGLPLVSSPAAAVQEEANPWAVEEAHQPSTTPMQTLDEALKYVTTAKWNEAVAQNRAIAAAAKKKIPKGSHRSSESSQGGNGHCGGNLPPCWVLDRESGHNDGDPNTYDVHAYNPNGCSGRGCYGKWQCDPNSCNGTGTEEEQDAEAARLWDGGAGCSHWAACG